MSPTPRRFSRRELLRSAAFGGSALLAGYVLGCGGEGEGSPTAAASPTATSPAAPTPTAPDLTPTATPAAGEGWRRVSAAGVQPPARRDHSLVTDGRRLYVFGGRDGGALGDHWRFDLEEGAWSEVPAADGPAARFGHNAIFDAAKGRILVFGGQAASGSFFDDVWAFDMAAGGWSRLEAGVVGPSPRYGAAGALDPGGRFLVSHGFTDAGRFDDTWSLSLAGDAWTDSSPQGERPIERCLMRAVWDTRVGRLLMFGGQTTGEPFLGDLWELSGGGWRELAVEPRPSPRNFYAMAFDEAGGRAVLFGGATAGGPVNDVWAFRSGTESWSELPVGGEAPSPRSGHDSVWLADRGSLLAFGGNDGSGNLNDLWELSLPASV